METLTSIIKFIGTVGLVLLGILILSIIFAVPIMWLWNWVMVDIFDLPSITLMQSWGLSMLTGLLFNKSATANKNKG